MADEAVLARTVFRKVAWRTLPLLGVGYFFSYTDRVNISFAAAQMNADLGFNAAVYGFGGGLFFLSYALMEVPSNLLFQRFGARLWISRIMLTWGVLAAATMFVHTAWQFYALRLLFGAAEAGFFPAVLVYLTRWFPLASRGRAISTFYIAWPLSTVVMGAVAGSLLKLDGLAGLRGWQWLLMLEGLPAALFALAIFLFLPERPEDATWLSPEEKTWLAAGGYARAAPALTSPHAGIASAFSNPRVLLLGLANALMLGTSYAFTLSAPQVLGLRMGISPANAGYLIALAGMAGVVAMLSNGLHADYRREHFLHVIAPMAMIAVGLSVLAASRSPVGAAAGFLIYAVGMYAGNGVFPVLISRLLEGPPLLIGVAVVNMIGQLGSFVLPTLYGLAQHKAGRLDGALWLLPLPFALAATTIAVLWVTSGGRRTARALPAT